jgi:hypothetical protein
MKVPPGATGFHVPPVEDEAVLRGFAAVCYQAARAVQGTVTGIVKAGVTPNFHTITIAQGEHLCCSTSGTERPVA